MEKVTDKEKVIDFLKKVIDSIEQFESDRKMHLEYSASNTGITELPNFDNPMFVEHGDLGGRYLEIKIHISNNKTIFDLIKERDEKE